MTFDIDINKLRKNSDIELYNDIIDLYDKEVVKLNKRLKESTVDTSIILRKERLKYNKFLKAINTNVFGINLRTDILNILKQGNDVVEYLGCNKRHSLYSYFVSEKTNYTLKNIKSDEIDIGIMYFINKAGININDYNYKSVIVDNETVAVEAIVNTTTRRKASRIFISKLVIENILEDVIPLIVNGIMHNELIKLSSKKETEETSNLKSNIDDVNIDSTNRMTSHKRIKSNSKIITGPKINTNYDKFILSYFICTLVKNKKIVIRHKRRAEFVRTLQQIIGNIDGSQFNWKLLYDNFTSDFNIEVPNDYTIYSDRINKLKTKEFFPEYKTTEKSTITANIIGEKIIFKTSLEELVVIIKILIYIDFIPLRNNKLEDIIRLIAGSVLFNETLEVDEQLLIDEFNKKTFTKKYLHLIAIFNN